MPLLTSPATIPEPTVPTAGEEKDEEEEEEVPGPTKKEKGGKKGKGGGGGKKNKGGKGKKDEGEAEKEEEAGEVLLIDEIWPKKEALGLTKWYVPSFLLGYVGGK
jgi:PUA domain protein